MRIMAGKTGDDSAALPLPFAVECRHVARLLRRSAVYKRHIRVISVSRNVHFGATAQAVAACAQLSAEIAL